MVNVLVLIHKISFLDTVHTVPNFHSDPIAASRHEEFLPKLLLRRSDSEMSGARVAMEHSEHLPEIFSWQTNSARSSIHSAEHQSSARFDPQLFKHSSVHLAISVKFPRFLLRGFLPIPDPSDHVPQDLVFLLFRERVSRPRFHGLVVQMIYIFAHIGFFFSSSISIVSWQVVHSGEGVGILICHTWPVYHFKFKSL